MKAVVKCLGACVIGLASLTLLRAADQPKVPENVRELMQDRKYDETAAEIDKLLAAKDDKPKNPDYLLYLKGRALHLAGKHREALQAFALIERDHADSQWARRAKFGQAAALLKSGDFEAAEHIYEEEVKFLLSTERKHEIASIYLEFADAYFQPPKVAGQEKKPDYQKALNFYKQALAVGPNDERRVEVEFRVARCHQELGQVAEAAAAYQAFLKAHPKSKLDIEARYRLGAVQLAQGQNVEARKTWKDLLDAHADRKMELRKELSDAYPSAETQRLAEAAYGISHTYGLPNPPSKEDLELGVAAAERFIANYPDIKLAARSALEIAQAYVQHNRQDEAIARLKKLLADKKYVGADVIPDARVLLGFAFQRQKKFPEAIAAWQEYLAKHAAHQSWAQVQQAIIDTEFITALEARRAGSAPGADAEAKTKKFAEARKLWDAFLSRYPLDGRAAAIMLEFGLMNFELGDVGVPPLGGEAEPAKAGTPTYDAAIADWTQLVSKYPNTEEASRGQYLIGLTYEEKLGRFDEALAAYRKLTWGQFAPRAAERISRLTRQELTVLTERVFRTNQQPQIKVTTRNIKQLSVKAYRVDLETYFRKMHLAHGIEALDIALIDPEKSWTFEVPNYADHKQLVSSIEVPLDSPGVMAVTVANEPKPTESAPPGITVRPQEATTMVMQSDLDILVKCSRNEVFVFAENLRTGKPFPGVKLLVSDGNKVFAEGTTNDDGVFVGAVSDQDKSWELLKSSNDVRVFALTQDAAPKGRAKQTQGASPGSRADDASPRANPQKLTELQKDHIIVHIDANNTVTIDDGQEPVEAADLERSLGEVHRRRGVSGGLIILASDKASHETVVSVVDAANQAGIMPIKLANPQKRSVRKQQGVSKSSPTQPADPSNENKKLNESQQTSVSTIPSPDDPAEEYVIISIRSDGSIWFAGDSSPTPQSELSKKLDLAKRTKPSITRVVVKAEKDVPFTLVRDVTKAVTPSGLELFMGVGELKELEQGTKPKNDADAAAASVHFASNVVGLQGVEFAQGISSKGYIYTERPTYRAGQLVHVRGVVRWVKGDEYFFEPGKKFKLDVYDSRGRQIRSEEVSLGEFGSFATRFMLPSEAPQGDYRLHVHDPAEPDRHNYQGTFAVHEYLLKPVQIEIDTPQKVYYRGDQIAGTIKLRYYYGSPVAEREIRYVLPDGTIHTETTNAAGEVPFKFDTREFREDQMLAIVVQYPEGNLQSGLNLFLSTHGFRATVATVRDVFISGETFDVTVTTTDAAGKKIGEKMTLAVVQRTEVQGQVGERTVEERPVATDKDKGTGRATIKIAAGGTYILRASGTDRFGNPVSAERTVTVSGDDDTVRLRILSDSHHYKAGDTASVQVHWRDDPALALVTYQGARVLGYRLVELKKGTNKLEIPITEKLAPNFDLVVSVMSDSGGEPRRATSAATRRQTKDAGSVTRLETEVTNGHTETANSDRATATSDRAIAPRQLANATSERANATSDAAMAVSDRADAASVVAMITSDRATPASDVETTPSDPATTTLDSATTPSVFATAATDCADAAQDGAENNQDPDQDRRAKPLDAKKDAEQITPLPSFHEATSPFEVERPLVVTLKPSRDRVLPGDEVEVAITATDPQGKPVRAELSLAMIEKSLLEIFPDQLAAIGNFFEGARRTSALRTVASCTFRYAPATHDISQTLIAEAGRVATVEMERVSREAAALEDVTLGVRVRRFDVDEVRAGLGEAVNSAFGEQGEDLSAANGVVMQGFSLPRGGADRQERGFTVTGGAGGSGLAAQQSGQRNMRRAGALSRENLGLAKQLEDKSAELRKHRVNLNLLDAAEKAAIPFPDEPALEYAGAHWFGRLTQREKDARFKYFSDSDADGLKEYAGYFIGRALTVEGKKSGQMAVLFSDGSVNNFDADFVYSGKLSDRVVKGGVTVLPEGFMRETGFWNPAVVTDDDGKATLTITVPDRSTAWQLAARGITTGSLTGQATAELVAKKDLFGELKLPLAFVDGDSAQILATVHNDAVAKGKIEVVLKTTIGGKAREEKRTIDVEKTGTHEITFDRDIAGSGEAVFELVVRAPLAPSAGRGAGGEDPSPQPSPPKRGEGAGIFAAGAVLEDSTRAVVPIRPYGIPVYSTTGGAASSNMTAWISPPAGMPVRDASLQIVVGPSVERSLLDVVLGPSGGVGGRYFDKMLVCESPLERTTSDLMASLGLLKLIGGTRDKGSPEASALADRVRSSVGYLVSTQNDDGGWHWSAARGTKQGSSDRNSSARALWSMSLARKAGFAVPDDAFNKAITFLQTAFTAARENDYDGKAMLLHALSTAGRGDFAYANRLHRSRPSLSATALAYLALSFVEMDRKEIARELVDLLAPKLGSVARPESAKGVDAKAPPSEPRPSQTQGVPPVEVRALYLAALNAVMPGDAKVKESADWLMARRSGSRWQPERATGPATLALANYFATTRFAAEHYTLKIFVNDNEVTELDIDGAAGSRVVEVPKEVLARGEKLPEKDFPGDQRKQRINFELNGRGRFTFNCTLTGFVAADQLKSTTNAYHLERYFDPAPIEFDGREIPRGFDVLTGPFTTWRNPVTELPVGRRAQVTLYYYPINGHLIPEDEREYVIITEPIPSGCTVLEKSITGQFDRYEIGPGYVTFYVGNRSQPNEIRFDIYGYTAGKFRTAPTIVRNFYDPERMMVSQPRPLTVLAAGQKSKDEYKLTPRELYELGKRHAARAGITGPLAATAGMAMPAPSPVREAAPAPCDEPAAPPTNDETAGPQDLALAAAHLTELFDKFQLKPEIYKEVAQLLFQVALVEGKAPAIVRYFEILKEKYPDLEVPFEHIVKVGAAYRELNEYERSYLVFRATAEASFARESEIGGFLESQGEFERSVAVMDRILREYPAEPYIASAAYALAQRVYAMAPNAAGDAKLRERKITKVDLIRDAIGRLDDFLIVWPDDPAADQASFSLASALVELESWPAAIARAQRYAERFPKSEYLDSFWFIIGYSHFARGEHRDALDMCRRVAAATRTDPATGRDIESRNKWQAIYISGQVHHSLGEPAEAITEYQRVADRFPDAKETIAYFTRKAIELPEITTVKPPVAAGDDERKQTGEVELKFRNVAACEVKVYRIDLLKFGLLQRDLSNITKINLAGIRPLHEEKVELGDGKDYHDRTKKLDLPLNDEGAYLVVCRGEDLHTSGLVLVTPLVLEVQEEAPSGRVRATVKNTVTDKYASEVQVKVIGSRNDKFKDGQTDLRGVFATDGIQGRSTVIARAGDGQYAFHRGSLELGPPPAPAAKPLAAKADQPAQTAAPAQTGQQQLLENLNQSNLMIQQQKGKELKDLYEKKQQGVKAQQAF